MQNNFTIDHYQKTIESYKNADYIFVNATEHIQAPKQISLVHDVDHDIMLCEKMAHVERESKISTTYFLRLHAKAYNMLSYGAISMAKKIINLGHKIGLHYEPTFCSNAENYEEHIKKEMNILSSVIDQEINVFNIHEPSRTGISLKNIMSKNNRCYNSPFYSEFKYLSDSSCNWREGCFSEHVNRWQKVLVLTHPLWWYEQSPTENY